MTGIVLDFLKRLLVPPPKETPPPAPPSVPAPKERPLTPERSQLLSQAMSIYRSKQAILADLSEEQRQMLVTVALKTFFNQSPPDSKDKKS
ncbi:MAG: hypothetical protein HQL43_10830 [Alphaproteobacteria bacterium]|jgi:hypothetical protein|nr:hypothetical protein [Alphaproteobacteria bacterium]